MWVDMQRKNISLCLCKGIICPNYKNTRCYKPREWIIKTMVVAGDAFCG